MYDTSYDENTIALFRKKYRWLILLQPYRYTVFIIVLIFSEKLIPDSWDTFGYYDAEKNFDYIFGIRQVVIMCMCTLIIVLLFYIVPLVTKAILKEKYVEFMVAKRNGNLLASKTRKKAFSIILAVFVSMYVFGTIDSWRSIDSITVTDNNFSIQNNELFTSTVNEYTFDYLNDNRPKFDGNDVAFVKTERFNNGISWKMTYFSIGKYSPYLEQLLAVMDEKTNGKYHLLLSVENDYVQCESIKTKIHTSAAGQS
jgi:hypothetical protein